MYPRETKDGQFIDLDQMVSASEHLLSKRMLCLAGAIGFQNVFEAQTLLLALDSLSHEPIKIFISSPGGDVDSTFMFYDTMRLLQSPVYTIGRYAASAAVLILAAGKKRYLLPHSKTMLHLIWGQAQGDLRDWEIQRTEMVRYQDAMVDALIECGAQRSKKQILQDIDRDFWLTPEEAMEYGLADKIITKGELGKWLK